MQKSPELLDAAEPFLRGERRSPAANALLDATLFVHQVLLTLILTPVILHFIGAEEYGVYALALVLVSSLSLLRLGMDGTVMRFLAASFARSDLDEANSVVGVALMFYLLVAVAGAGLAAVFGQFFVGAFSLSPELEGSASFVFSVSGLWFFFSTLQMPVLAISGALQRFDIAVVAMLIAATAYAISSVLVLWLGWGLRGLIIVGALQQAVVLALVVQRNTRLVPGLRLRPAYERTLMRRMMSFSGYAFVSNLASTVLLQLDKIVLGALTSVSVVTYYVIPSNVASYLNAGVLRLATIAIPLTTDLHVRGEKEELRRFYVRATRLLVLVVVAFAVPAFMFSREILLHWLGSSFATTSFGAFRLLILTNVLLALFALPYFLTLGFGRPQIAALFNLVTAAINVVLIFILIPVYGLIGAAVAYLVSVLTVPPAILYVERRLLDLDASPWPALVARLSPVVAAQIVVSLLLRQLVSGLPELLGILLLSGAVAPGVALATGYLTRQDRAMIARYLPVGRLVRASRRRAW